MKLPTEQFLCSFKCPFCGDKVEVTSESKSDSWIKVQGFCEGQSDVNCGVGFDFGTFSPAFTLDEMKLPVMQVVGLNFIN